MEEFDIGQLSEEELLSTFDDDSEAAELYHSAKLAGDYFLVIETSVDSLNYNNLQREQYLKKCESNSNMFIRIINGFMKSFSFTHPALYVHETELPNELIEDSGFIFLGIALWRKAKNTSQYNHNLISHVYDFPKTFVIARIKRQTSPALFLWPLHKLAIWFKQKLGISSFILFDLSKKEENNGISCIYKTSVINENAGTVSMALSILFGLSEDDKFKELDKIRLHHAFESVIQNQFPVYQKSTL